jgi:hypothetical protein
MEDEEQFGEWEFHDALEILESDIADVDTTNVKLVSITSHSMKCILITVSLLLSFWAFAVLFADYGGGPLYCLLHQSYT